MPGAEGSLTSADAARRHGDGEPGARRSFPRSTTLPAPVVTWKRLPTRRSLETTMAVRLSPGAVSEGTRIVSAGTAAVALLALAPARNASVIVPRNLPPVTWKLSRFCAPRARGRCFALSGGLRPRSDCEARLPNSNALESTENQREMEAGGA